MREVGQGINPRTFAVQIKSGLKAGAQMKPLKGVANADTFDELDIEHDGKVMLIDFWATWCPPCQAPMKHNDEMLAKHSEDWKDNVRIIGISIDQEADKVMPHVKKHGYGRVEHYLRASSTCDDDYNVEGVPHVVLVDRKGKIQYIGHPMKTNLEEDIHKLVTTDEDLAHLAGGEEESKDESGNYQAMTFEEAEAQTKAIEKALTDSKADLKEGAS